MNQGDQLRQIRRLLRQPDLQEFESTTGKLTSTEWIAVALELEPTDLASLFPQLPNDIVLEIITRLSPVVAARTMHRLPRSNVAHLLGLLRSDDATDILQNFPSHFAEEVLGELAPNDTARLRQLMAYPPDTAGGRMTPAFVAVLPHLNAVDAIDRIRKAVEREDSVSYVYVVNDTDQFLGVLSLSELILAKSDTSARDLMHSGAISVQVGTDQEEAARLLIEHNLLALPVLDDAGRLVGILTEDDVADVLEEEATEDIVRLGGSQPLETPYRHATIPLLFRKRIVWLLVLFIAEAYTGTVMRFFEDELEQVVALAFFIPLLIGTGGNIGSQITTTLVRAMAVGEVSLRDVRWVLAKEAGVGVVIGAVMATVAFGRAQILGVGSDVAWVVAVAIAVISIWASLVAAILPMALRRLRIDPTVVSAPFITTLVDGTGLIIYFSIAKFVLGL